MFKKIFSITCLSLIIFSNVFATSYMYDLKNIESSISANNDAIFEFQSKSQVLIEPYSGTVIYVNNENEKIAPASVTKIMTMLLIMENIDSGKLSYDDTITCSLNSSGMGGSQIWFKEGEKLTVHDALKAIAVVSANDVSVAMAEHIGGSESNFVKMMNDKAKELQMLNTNFINCHGIDEENHFTTALDISKMARELYVKHPDILKFTSIWMDSIRDGEFELSSTNKLIKFYDGANGLKTGSTSKALFSLAGSAKRGETSFISVICTAPSSDIRLAETKQLLDYGFNNYETKKIIEKNTILDNIEINKSIGNKYNVILKEDIEILNEKGVNKEYINKVEYNTNITLPLSINDEIGRVKIFDLENNLISEKPIYVNQDIYKSNIIDYLKHMIKIIVM